MEQCGPMNDQAQPPSEERSDQQNNHFDHCHEPFTHSFNTVRWLVSTLSNASCKRFV